MNCGRIVRVPEGYTGKLNSKHSMEKNYSDTLLALGHC